MSLEIIVRARLQDVQNLMWRGRILDAIALAKTAVTLAQQSEDDALLDDCMGMLADAVAAK
jgi:hypothetical protein